MNRELTITERWTEHKENAQALAAGGRRMNRELTITERWSEHRKMRRRRQGKRVKEQREHIRNLMASRTWRHKNDKGKSGKGDTGRHDTQPYNWALPMLPTPQQTPTQRRLVVRRQP